mmetsp:Transcript_9988/g.17867  ORF Transcript_9988/g.17867 Transcript_9988/m.17867 type:complete len:414 (+) Transcript_9988:2-1243(+)
MNSATSSITSATKEATAGGAVTTSAAQADNKPSTSPPSSLRITLPTHSNLAKKAASGNKRNADGGVRNKRVSSSGKTGTGAASISSGIGPNSSPYIRLPAVGDPKKARWRAAHFLYYQRPDPEQQEQSTDATGGNSNNNTAKVPERPRYVIYEGEEVNGYREGRGICLYNNGLLYEGEWKRNKEHGYGKLMSSDRQKLIYEGEWERGRIQGTGTYYYGSSDPLNPGSRYIGEFKENLRHGMGRYFFPDGSCYDGQWRDGVMHGRGVFTWPDNSVYDGEWKDGKRTGQGLLKAGDGFIYDGTWVNNSMEGRGVAIYPSGQKFEGMFSNGRREGRGTIHFTNGATYEGRFRDDAVDGQGTMKMTRVMVVPRKQDDDTNAEEMAEEDKKDDFMIPISFQSDMTHIHTRAGFTAHGE